MDEQIQLAAFRAPALESGEYELVVKQSLSVADKEPYAATTTYFSVRGPRFALDPELVGSFYPPANAVGDFALCLPHIILNRNTLPWERSPMGGTKDAPVPWLALLLVDASEAGQYSVKTMSVVEALSKARLSKEFGDTDVEQVQVLTLEDGLKKKLLPSKADLALLSHTRAKLVDGRTVEEIAVCMGGRLPLAGGLNTVYLVSFDDVDPDAEIRKAGALSLILLKSWSFTCTLEQHSFSGQFNKVRPSGVKPMLAAVSNSVDPKGKEYIDAGYAPLHHVLRTGTRTRSWYHGPLHPGLGGVKVDSGARHADASLVLDATSRMLDVSYAAAWELGRWLTLRNKRVASSLYLWKRRYAQLRERAAVPPTTSVGPRWVTQLPDLPGPVRDWFIGLGLLHGVPFHYLVPDPEMLSPESIQFFSVDGQWLERLCDGAFSVGRSSYKDDDLATPENEGDLTVQWQADDKSPLCGFLLRSSVITDWPDVEIIGWSQKPGSDFDDPAGPKKMVVVRKELIAPGVLLCLFEGGQMEALAFQKKAETLHFSFSREMKDGPVFKFPRKKDGTETNNDASLRLLIGGVDPDGPRKVDLAALCNGLTMGDRYGYGGAISSAELGMALLGGSEKVWFLRA